MKAPQTAQHSLDRAHSRSFVIMCLAVARNTLGRVESGDNWRQGQAWRGNGRRTADWGAPQRVAPASTDRASHN